MRRERRALLEALASIADAAPVDWEAAQSAKGRSSDAAMRALRTIAGVAEIHRAAATDREATAPMTRPPARVVGRIGPAAGERPPSSAAAPDRWNGLIVRERLAEGSFGEVYLAYDPRLDREVALKLLKLPERAGADLAEQALREARALARVRHEHVVCVHGAESHDGRVGLWMELIRGRSLEQAIARQGTFGAREAALIGQDICRALGAVHHAGLIHGDVKAQNVMRENGGRIVLMDFGSGTDREAAAAGALQSGTALYLAPERLAGGPPSVASDVYAVGVLLYHLVTGQYCFEATTLPELLAAHERGAQVPLHERRPDLPDGFVRVIERALMRDPADRFQSAADMQRALASVLGEPAAALAQNAASPHVGWRRAAAACALAAAAIALALVLWYRAPAAPPVTRNSVAVIPFRSGGAAGDMEYLAAGMAEEVSVALSRLPGLRVVSGTSVRRYAGSDRPSDEIGRALRVATLVTGSVQISRDAVRVVAELLDCESSQQLWADTFEATHDAIPALRARVASGIGTALKGRLTSSEARLLGGQPMDPEVYRLYLQGRYLLNKRTEAELRVSIENFKAAIARDRSAAEAYAGLADAYLLSSLYGLMPPGDAQRQAVEHAKEAIRLKPSLADAHAALASAYHEQWAFSQAEEEYAQAIALNRNYAPAHHWYALFLAQAGRFVEARNRIDYAYSLDPSSAVATARGVVRYVSGDVQGAIGAFLNVLAVDPGFGPAHRALAEAYAMQQRFGEALQSLARARSLSAPSDVFRALEAYIRAASGDRDGARAILREMEDAADQEPAGGVDVAAAYLELGDARRGLAWLRRALAARDGALLYAEVEPRWERLRSHPECRKLLDTVRSGDTPKGGA